VQAPAIDDGKFPDLGSIGHNGRRAVLIEGPVHDDGYFPERTREAILMYLRPASWA
jgi:hypothetical protein